MSPAKPPGYLPTFCLHFLLPNALLIVLALATGAIGGEYGIQYLVWHDDPVKQFWVGFALAIVSLQALYIGFLLWGKKAGRPERLVLYPQFADRVNAGLFGTYCTWVVGQLVVLVAVVGGIVLLIQKVDAGASGAVEAQVVATDDPNNLPPPRPNYGPWLVLGASAAAIAVFVGGWLAKHAIRLISTPAAAHAPRKLMSWLIDSTEAQPPASHTGGLLLSLWAARTHGAPYRRLWVAIFIQTLCVSVGVVFAAVWELSHVTV